MVPRADERRPEKGTVSGDRPHCIGGGGAGVREGFGDD